MKRIGWICLLCLSALSTWADTKVKGDVSIGFETAPSNLNEYTEYYYGSGHSYTMNYNSKPLDLLLSYGMNLGFTLHPKHVLKLNFSGTNNYRRNPGERMEKSMDEHGNLLSSVRSNYNDLRGSNEKDLQTGAQYIYYMKHPGEQLSFSYQYMRKHEYVDREQEVVEQTAFNRFQFMQLNAKYKTEEHTTNLQYIHPIAKGHVLTMDARYNARLLNNYNKQYLDHESVLDNDFRHTSRYGAAVLGYRMATGHVQALAQMEYRYTRFGERNLNDVIPFTRIAWQIDSIHSLSAQYGVRIIRPQAFHLNPAHITGAYTDEYGNTNITGTHVHNVSLSYNMNKKRARLGATVAYITANDGITSIRLEKNDLRTYTWGNEGLRHAVSFTPSFAYHFPTNTNIQAQTTVMWDERVAKAVNLRLGHWGVDASVKVEQTLPHSIKLGAHYDYTYGQTLDIYSYAGKGVKTGADLSMGFLPKKNLRMNLAYNYVLQPDIHMIEGFYTGMMHLSPGNHHHAAIRLVYNF